MISSACIAFLALANFGTISVSKSVKDELGFYRYATHNCGDHARQAISTLGQVMNFLQRLYKLERPKRPRPFAGKVPLVPLLHLAAQFGLEAAVVGLLQQGYDPNPRDHLDQTPLILAAGNGYDAMVKLLINHHATTDLVYRDDYTAVHHAAKGGNNSTVQLLLSDDMTMASTISLLANSNCSPLHVAAGRGHVAYVQLLLTSFAVDSKDWLGRTPLTHAVEGGHIDVARLLLETGAAV